MLPSDILLAPDPHHAWIEQNMGQLAQYPEQLIAIHPIEGIVLNSPDSKDFSRRLKDLAQSNPTLHRQLLVTHTSQYLLDMDDDGDE